jgi:hypothetical protein
MIGGNYLVMIQTVLTKANEVMRQFDEAKEVNPYEYILWKD